MNIKLKPVKLVLGKKYMVSFEGSKTIHICKLIKVTPKGYNFLAEDMDKCLFVKHFYVSNCSNHLNGTWFWMLDSVKITEYIEPTKPKVVETEKPSILNYTDYKEAQIKKGEDYSWVDYNNKVLKMKKPKSVTIIDVSGSMK